MINITINTIKDRFFYIIIATILIAIITNPDLSIESNMFWILLYTVVSSVPGNLSAGYMSTLPIPMINIFHQKLIETMVVLIVLFSVAVSKDKAFTDPIIFIYMLEIIFSSMYYKLNVGKKSLQKKYVIFDLALIIAVWFLFSLASSINLKMLLLLIPATGVVYRLKALKKMDYE